MMKKRLHIIVGINISKHANVNCNAEKGFFIAKVGHLIKIVAALLCTLTIVYVHHVTSDSLPNSPF